MGFLKFTACLALGILVLYQMGMLQAASFKPTMERNSHRASLSDEEGDLLLAVLVEQFMKMMAGRRQVTLGFSLTPEKIACNTTTCFIHKLARLLMKSEAWHTPACFSLAWLPKSLAGKAGTLMLDDDNDYRKIPMNLNSTLNLP